MPTAAFGASSPDDGSPAYDWQLIALVVLGSLTVVCGTARFCYFFWMESGVRRLKTSASGQWVLESARSLRKFGSMRNLNGSLRSMSFHVRRAGGAEEDGDDTPPGPPDGHPGSPVTPATAWDVKRP